LGSTIHRRHSTPRRRRSRSRQTTGSYCSDEWSPQSRGRQYCWDRDIPIGAREQCRPVVARPRTFPAPQGTRPAWGTKRSVGTRPHDPFGFRGSGRV
jgi:hypothetical protein